MMEKARLEDLHIPSTWKRIGAYFLDQLVIGLLFFPMWGFWYDLMNSEEEVFAPLSLFIFLLLFPLIYESLFLALFQQTPGQWILGLWVVPRHEPGKRLSWVQVFLRALTNRLSLFFSFAPFALAFFRYDRTHLGDWIAETRVLQEGRRPQPPKIRWVLGSLAVLFYVNNGFEQAIYACDSIDWDSRRVDLREAFAPGGGFDGIDFILNEDAD